MKQTIIIAYWITVSHMKCSPKKIKYAEVTKQNQTSDRNNVGKTQTLSVSQRRANQDIIQLLS